MPHPVPAVFGGPVLRMRMTVAYDGRDFHGFAENDGVRTVAGDLVAAIAKVLHIDGPVELTAAGRTDRGVHALGQVVTFDVPAKVDPDWLMKRLNLLVGPEIAVREARWVPDTFDARHSARSRTYRYVVWNHPEPDPFRAGRAWHVAHPLDLDALRLSCDPFIGLHDFAAFCRRATRQDGTPVTLRRRVNASSWHEVEPGVLHFEINASSFCHQMVRSVVGTMVEVGRGQRRAGDLLDVIRSGDRAAAGVLAPPDGLYLLAVGYPEEMRR